jgi:uncharacterized UBP type Zn finger protein
VNGWHETYNDEPGPDVVCGHLGLIANPPVSVGPPDACQECLVEGTTWVDLRRCLVCGVTSCCESSPRRHAIAHYERTGHPVMAARSDSQEWGWCYADSLALSPGD